ncbi:MAG: hypothetical protein V4672_12895 [Verrucomicrobiota bacterium]
MKNYVVTFSANNGSYQVVAGTRFDISKEGVLTIFSANTAVAAFNPAFWKGISEQ